MPVVRIEQKAFSLLVAEAQRLEVSVKDLLTMLVLTYFGEIEEAEEEEGEEEEGKEEEGEEEES